MQPWLLALTDGPPCRAVPQLPLHSYVKTGALHLHHPHRLHLQQSAR